jgi:hypothetical protein
MQKGAEEVHGQPANRMAVGDYRGFAAKAGFRLVAIFLALFDDISIFFLFLHPFFEHY